MHVGFAISKVDEDEARQTYEYLEQAGLLDEEERALKYIDEYRDAEVALGLARRSRPATRPWVLMEICGGQTHTIMRYGLDEMLPPESNWCTVPAARFAWRRSRSSIRRWPSPLVPGVIFVSYGDMLRVPGSHSDLFRVKARAATCASSIRRWRR